jgi:ABC-type transporter Mla subunit MlaD
MRRITLIAAILASGTAWLAAGAGADDSHTYKIEMFNAFGVVEGSDIRVAGVNVGSITDLDLNEEKNAVVTVETSGPLGVLGEDSRCSAEPQSLIAEYFIDCEPRGDALPENGQIPAEQVRITVQTDLVGNTLREPFRDRLQILINEFGTALAGNPERLNTAIRLGAPALEQLHQALKILAEQNTVIRDLNANSDRIIARLTERRDDVVRAIQEIRDASAASAARRTDLSADFDLLDDFLAELQPTIRDVGRLAVESTPLLRDLRAAAPGLNTLATNLPAFNEATRVSLDSLGEAAVVGRRALRRGRDEIEALADAGERAPVTAEMLADFLRDIDDPERAIEIDDRAGRRCGARSRPCYSTGRRHPTGYTGLEGLLNYVYYQPGALNQFDDVGHLLHFTLYYVETGPCGHFYSGYDPATGEPGLPTETFDGAMPDADDTTTNLLDTARCVGGLGPNQPGINEDLGLPPYHPSVCPDGTEPEAAHDLCPPTKRKRAAAEQRGAAAGLTAERDAAARGDGGAADPSAAPTTPSLDPLDLPQADGLPPNLDDLLGLPEQGLPADVGELLGPRDNQVSGQAAQDLLDFLFAP